MPVVGSWEIKRVLITVRTYPTPARKGVEVSCTAGITEDGKWIRLFPIPYRFLDDPKRFRKYQWIEVRVAKSSDSRPESYQVDIDSIRLIAPPLSYANNWAERKDAVFPLISPSLCSLYRQHTANNEPTLGFFKPKFITSLEIDPCEDGPDWSAADLARLSQTSMFNPVPKQRLEKIPYIFSYKFICDEASCGGHELSCTDWELAESYRKWRREYGERWQEKLRQRYQYDMTRLNDTHFFVGTISNHPRNWIIIGLFYPRKSLPQLAFFG